MAPERIPAAEARIAETERRLNRLDDLPAIVAGLAERLGSHTLEMERWQQRQDDLLREMHGTLKVVVEQTAESRGSTRTRKAIVAGALVIAGLMLTVLGLGLQALGLFG